MTSIPEGMFDDCSQLKYVYFPSSITTIGVCAFSGCDLSTTTLPKNLYKVQRYGFSSSKINISELPASVKYIEDYGFSFCKNITSLTFKSVPSSIGSNAFWGCDNLKTINVPWVKGKVANAPWGATNATINYNYTGE